MADAGGDQSLLELEHVIGYTGKAPASVHWDPNSPLSVFYSMGTMIVRHSDIGDPHMQEFMRGHDEEISALAVSPSGKLLASGQHGSTMQKGEEAPVLVWDVESKRVLYELLGIRGVVTSVTFSTDDRFLCATGSQGPLYIWDMQTGEIILGKMFPKPVTFALWGEPTGSGRRPNYTLITSSDHVVDVNTLSFSVASMQYALTRETCQMPSTGLIRDFPCASLSEDKRYALCGTAVGDFIVFKIDGGVNVYRASVPVSSNGVTSIVVGAGHVFAGAGDGKIKKLSGEDTQWTLEGETQLSGKVASMSLNAAQTELIVGTTAGKMFRVATSNLAATEIAESHVTPINTIAFGQRSDLFATVSSTGSLRVWDLSDYVVLSRANVRAGGLALAFADNENSIVSGWDDQFIRAHDLTTGASKWEIPNAHRGGVTALAVTDGYIASGGEDGIVRIWTRSTHEFIFQFTEHKKPVSSVLVDTKQPHILHSCSLDRTVFTYDLKAERRIVNHMAKDCSFTAMTQRLDREDELITVGVDGRIMTWDCDMADPVDVLLDPNRMRLNSVAVSPLTGKFLAVCGDDHQVKVYSLVDEGLVACCHGHSGKAVELRWSPDEKQLVSVSVDATIVVWNWYGSV